MAIKLDLVGKKSDPIPFAYTWKDTVLYALGVGAKIASLPWNPEGVVVISYKDGKGSMIQIELDPDTADYQLIEYQSERGTSYVINGSKTWITNARRSGLVALLCKTDPAAQPAHAGISIVLAEPGPGFIVSRDLPKLGYKGVESCEITFEDFRVPDSALLGEREGDGFAQMMRGLEIGRIQVASRALGVGQAALEDSLRYAQQREAFGQPIWKHQSIGNYLADMVTKLTAARQLVLYAARCYDSGRRADMEAGMAKLFASETAMEIALDAMRIHGGYGYSTEFDVERYFRDAPLMIVGEGTNEIQRNVIARQLIQRNPVTS